MPGVYAAVDHVQVVLPAASGLARDNVVNTFTFQAGTDLTAPDYGAIDTAILGFYNTLPTGGTHALGAYIAASISRSVNITTKHFRVEGHLDGTPSGSPVAIGSPGTLTGTILGSTGGFPSECAVALGQHGPYGAAVEFGTGLPKTRPRSRLRGRQYIGPLSNHADVSSVESTTNRIKVNTTLQSDFLGAGKAMFDALQGHSPAINWVVWSRANADIAVINLLTVDDAFDTQRRRGQRSVARSTMAVP